MCSGLTFGILFSCEFLKQKVYTWANCICMQVKGKSGLEYPEPHILKRATERPFQYTAISMFSWCPSFTLIVCSNISSKHVSHYKKGNQHRTLKTGQCNLANGELEMSEPIHNRDRSIIVYLIYAAGSLKCICKGDYGILSLFTSSHHIIVTGFSQ